MSFLTVDLMLDQGQQGQKRSSTEVQSGWCSKFGFDNNYGFFTQTILLKSQNPLHKFN